MNRLLIPGIIAFVLGLVLIVGCGASGPQGSSTPITEASQSAPLDGGTDAGDVGHLLTGEDPCNSVSARRQYQPIVENGVIFYCY